MLHYVCLVTQSCLTLSNPMKHSPPGSSVHGDFPGKNTGVGCHALLQGIFPTQGSNPFLQHCRKILYQLSHQESPQYIRDELSYKCWFLQGNKCARCIYIICILYMCSYIYHEDKQKILNTELSENNTFIFQKINISIGQNKWFEYLI